MDKTIYTRQQECLQQFIIAMRRKVGLTQRQLAQRLSRERNLIARLEVGQRRLDVVEFFWLCKACNTDPIRAAQLLMRKLDAIGVQSSVPE